MANPYRECDQVFRKADQEPMTVVRVIDDTHVICSLDCDEEEQGAYSLDAIFDVNSDAQFVDMT